ncbi:PLP-dependent aminotransferase family protein [Labrenzia sp. OB1]|uniref:MocR-like pyridoxine biosynthesis transcription factor PdxR n=1 Tax=Labrenzia sp. OB1 TaxID=1561204 RepID=UPI00083824F2|nr:PLP-dependent aminotransferase family protein [Labrenzia sp. OB1]
MTEPVFPDGILTLDRSGDIPLPEQIYRGLREAVRAGLLPSGVRLPSTRRLASLLDVARNTVNTAYELLQAEGIISVRAGAAPRIAEGLFPDGVSAGTPEPSSMPALSRRGRMLAVDFHGDGWVARHGSLQPGAPALDCFPYEEWARCLRRAARLERSADLQYRNFSGVPALKRQLSRHLAAERGVRADPDQILITCSMQASLALLSQALADTGDEVWLEEPGYLGARTAFHSAGFRIRPLPTDEQGADAAGMTTGDRPPKLIYVTPSHHYPLGARMPLARRLGLLEAARSAGAVILEDDYDSEFLFSGRPVAALYGLAGEGQVIYLGTFSKSLMPGLHIAFCVVPELLVEPLSQLMRNMGCAANVQAQAALANFMDNGAYQKHLKLIRRVYLERGEMLVSALKGRLGNWIDVEPPAGNVQVALTFREELDDRALARAMHRSGFAVSALSKCFLGEYKQSGLIIGFAGATPEQISAGVDTLGNLLEQTVDA